MAQVSLTITGTTTSEVAEACARFAAATRGSVASAAAAGSSSAAVAEVAAAEPPKLKVGRPKREAIDEAKVASVAERQTALAKQNAGEPAPEVPEEAEVGEDTGKVMEVADEAKPDLSDVRAAFDYLFEAAGQDGTKKLCAEFGVARVREVEEKDWSALIKRAKEIAGEVKSAKKAKK